MLRRCLPPSWHSNANLLRIYHCELVTRDTSLCHTDLEEVDGQPGPALPFVPGHKAAGVVEWTGSSVDRLSVGDHVVLSWNPHYGHCYFCAREQSILCEQYRANAIQSMHFDGKARIFTVNSLFIS